MGLNRFHSEWWLSLAEIRDYDQRFGEQHFGGSRSPVDRPDLIH